MSADGGSNWTVFRATTFFGRLGGLLVRPALQARQALLLTRCSSVHTAFMPYAIDVLFLDESGRLLQVAWGVRPWSLASCNAACLTLELLAGQGQALVAQLDGRAAWRLPLRRGLRPK